MINKFNIPQKYIEMNNLGWLSRKKNLNNYLWIDDMEWLEVDDILNYEYEEYELENIVPFAYTVGGDKWGWYCDDNMLIKSIVLCYHDDDEGVFYADNLESAIFRNILEYVSDSNFYCNADEGKTYQIGILELRKLLNDWKNKFINWFDDEWIGELSTLSKLELKLCITEYGSYYALITPEEAEKKIEKYLKFPFINKRFRWTK